MQELRNEVIQRYIGKANEIPFVSQFIPLMQETNWSKQAQANVAHQVQFESEGSPKYEDLRYRADKIVSNFGNRKFFAKMKPAQKLEAAKALVSQGEEAIANAIYGGVNGNTDAGDGFKYRGRGFIQLTGKANYADIGKRIGYDLVNNPDLLINDRNVSQLAALEFLKREQQKKKLNYDNLKDVSTAINPKESFESRMQKAEVRKIDVLTPEELDAFTPAEDNELRKAFHAGKISIQTYMEKRGF